MSIKGLSNLLYIDKVAKNAQVIDTNDSITIDQEVDRIYVNVPSDEIHINLGQDDSDNLTLKKINLKDTGNPLNPSLSILYVYRFNISTLFLK